MSLLKFAEMSNEELIELHNSAKTKMCNMMALDIDTLTNFEAIQNELKRRGLNVETKERRDSSSSGK